MAAITLGGAKTAADGSLAAWPDWRLTVTQGATTFTVGALPSTGVPAAIRQVARISRQARQGGRGSLSITLANVPDPTSGVRLSDAFTAATPLEGALVSFRVIAGATDAIIWTGKVSEVRHLDDTTLELDCVDGAAWFEELAAVPITASTWPLAADDVLGTGSPVCCGLVTQCAPPLVRRPPETTLTAAITSGATSCQVADTAGFAASGPARIGAEHVSYASTTPTTLEGLTRSNPTSHIATEVVAERGNLVYLVSNGANAIVGTDNLRLDLENAAEPVPIPAGITVTEALGPPATITLSEQPELETFSGSDLSACLYDLDTVAHSDLSAADAQKCLALAEGYDSNEHADLDNGEGTGGLRSIAVDVPAGATYQRAYVVIEAEGHVELRTTLDGAHSAVVTTITVEDTTGFPSSGQAWLANGSGMVGTPELIAYTGTSATTLTGVTRGLNNAGTGYAQPSGAPCTLDQVRVHFDLAGGASANANAIGHLSPGADVAPPESVACQKLIGSHGLGTGQHSHTIPGHDHSWDSTHDHPAGGVQRVDGQAVAVKFGIGGGTGSPVAQGVASFANEMIDPAVAKAYDITHTNVPGPIAGGYDRTNWWAVLFPSAPFAGDARPVVSVDYFLTVSGLGGGVQVVSDGAAGGTINPAFPPVMTVTSHPVIPPEAEALGLTDGLLAQTGTHGTWRNKGTMSPSSPATGAELTIEHTGSVDPFQVWGADAGSDDKGSLPMAAPGYLQLDDGAGTTEWVRYAGARWDATRTDLILETITRGSYGSSAGTFAAGAGTINKYPTRGHYGVRFAHVGVGQVSGADGAAMATVDGNPGTLYTLQSECQRVIDTYPDSKEPALFTFTMGELFEGSSYITPGGSLVPFNAATTDIFEQYGGTVKNVPRSPVLWVRAHTNIQVHAAWCEVIAETFTDEELADDGLDIAIEPTDPADSLKMSNLTWLEITDQVDEPSDLVDASIIVERIDTGPGPFSTARILRLFYVLEMSAPSGSQVERPQRLTLDIHGTGTAGVPVSGSEALRRLVIEAMGQTPASVLDEASFTAAAALTSKGGAYIRALEPGSKVAASMAEQFRLATTWDDDAKLSVAYLPDRDSVPAPSVTLTVDDVAMDSVVVRRGKTANIRGDATVRGAYSEQKGAHTLTGTPAVPTDTSKPVEYDAPHLTDQAGVTDFANHLVDYGRDVSVRVGFDTFTQGLTLLPGAIIGLTHPELTSAALFVESIDIDPSGKKPAFCHVECRDLTEP